MRDDSIKKDLPGLFNLNVDLPANPVISGGINLSIGNRTLLGLGLLVFGSLFIILRKRRKS